MKKILPLLLLLFISVSALPARELTKEWRQYERLARKDRPRDQIAKLHEIRALALERRLPDDLLEACRKEEQVYRRMNWKSADSLSTALREVIESFGMPLLTYQWLYKDWEYAKAHQEELSAGYHPILQDRQIPFLQTGKTDDIADDFEWILWDRLIRVPSLFPDSEETRLLTEKIGDRYPARPYLEFLKAKEAKDRFSAMEALAKQYAGNPFRFLPENEMLKDRWYHLQREKRPSEADAKALYDDAEAFTKAIKAEKGVHQRVDLSVDHIRQGLRQSQLWIAFKNDSIVLTGRNFGKGALEFVSDEHRERVSFRNKDGRFYVMDTVKAPIPVLPDGSYRIQSANLFSRPSYEKHTLSIAVRQQGDEFAVYVADYMTGEPLPSATIRLRRGKKTIAREISLNGFTPLPADFQKMIGNKKYCDLEARVGERRSATISVYKPSKYVEIPPANLHGRVFLDRGAYRPGDTLKGKAVLFKGDLNKSANTVGKGEDVRIHIFSAEGKVMNDNNLKTNAFGAVAWEWPIPVGERNGLYGIYVFYGKSNVTHAEFRIDDFVLPTYEITFAPQEEPYYPDSLFTITGKVASYSGHPVDGISLKGTVTRYGVGKWKGPVAIDKDGTFRIPLRLSDRGDHRLTLEAVDATGESFKVVHDFKVDPSLSLSVKLENAAEGEVSLRPGKTEKTLLTENTARFAWTVKNGSQPVKLPVAYRLVDEYGKVIREGTSEEHLELDLSDCPDGLYTLMGKIDDGEPRGRLELPVLKITSVLDAPVRSVFLAGETEVEYGERIQARLGAGDGPLWAVATLFAPDGSILESRLVHLEGNRGGAGSMMDLGFTYKGSYPDAVRLEVFYFRDAEKVTHEAVYHRVRHEMDLPLSFSRFVDQTMPGAPCTLTLQMDPGAEAAVAVFDKSLDVMNPNDWERVTLLQPVFRNAWSSSRNGSVSGESIKRASGKVVPVPVKGEGPVYGIVTDMAGEPIIGASVVQEGTVNGVVTDVDGCFSMKVPVGTWLNVYCIGYKDATIRGDSGIQIFLEEDVQYLEETVVIGYGVQKKASLTGAIRGIKVRGLTSKRDSEPEYEPAIYGYRSPGSADDNVPMPDFAGEAYREIFSEALAFEPFLYPDETGKVDVTFKTSDKLSSYHVNVFAHDTRMRNAVLRRDFVVTIPVRISVNQPRYLYDKDEYELSATVSSVSDTPITGRLYLQVEQGGEEQSVQYADLTVPAGGTAAAVYSVAAPFADGKELNLRMIFQADNFSDALRLNVPVYPAAQTLTESHSALAGPEAADSLRRKFVNIPGDQAEVTVRTLREVVEAGLSEWTAPEDPDALSRSANFFARALLGQDTTGTLKPLMELRNEDGGFAWVDGMDSSPVVTATLLERFATLRDKGIAIPDMEATVHYLDISQFGNWFPRWCGGLSDEQYMDIRAMWASVPFDLTGVEEKAVRRYRLKDFRWFARNYLSPGRYDYANGWVLDRARRVRTLQNLLASEEGIALGQAWGEVILTASRFRKTITNDLETIRQYAVRHPSSALYYPNAVLPFRGILASEVYAHTLVSNLLEGPISDGVKLWLVLQNETQSWTGDPAYVEALQSVLNGSESLLDRQIVTLTATKAVPFEDIKSVGNQMRVERKFFKKKFDTMAEIQPGTTLNVGDRIVARYVITSTENRSFVRLDAFHEASLQPVEQRSGPSDNNDRKSGIVAYQVDGLWTRVPEFYRDVRVDRTIWWIDVCPENTTVWEEELFVTQAGTFTAPVVTVESLYAPGYRANAAFQGPLRSE